MSRNAPLTEARDRKRTMADYDALPRDLRDWLAGARLQWEPRSAHRAWRKALWKSLGRKAAARAYMDALEDAALARDAETWAKPTPQDCDKSSTVRR